MNGVLSRFTKGLIDAGEYAVVMRPDDWAYNGGKGGVVYCGAYSAGAVNILGLLNRFDIVRAGYPIAASDLGDVPTQFAGSGTTGGPGVWGNNQSQTKLEHVFFHMEDALVAGPKQLLVAGSHGAAAALRFAHDNPGQVCGVACFIGAINVEDIRANNRNGYAASINTAFGLSGGASVPAAANPATLAATWPTDVPVRLWYSSSDPICVEATQTAFNSNAPVGADVDVINFGDHGHTTAGLPWEDITTFALEKLAV